jgi:hypothetical protein
VRVGAHCASVDWPFSTRTASSPAYSDTRCGCGRAKGYRTTRVAKWSKEDERGGSYRSC